MKWETADPMLYDVLKANATQMRNNPTEAESALWQHLKSSQLGVKFLRQHIIGEYIVDFLCRKNNLVIEIDGGYHFTKTPPTPLFRGEQESKPLTGDMLTDLYHHDEIPWYNDPDQIRRDKERQDWLWVHGLQGNSIYQRASLVPACPEHSRRNTDNVINKIKNNL